MQILSQLFWKTKVLNFLIQTSQEMQKTKKRKPHYYPLSPRSAYWNVHFLPKFLLFLWQKNLKIWTKFVINCPMWQHIVEICHYERWYIMHLYMSKPHKTMTEIVNQYISNCKKNWPKKDTNESTKHIKWL